MNILRKFFVLTIVLISNSSLGASDYLDLGINILSDLVAIESTANEGLATEASEHSKTLLINRGFKEDHLLVVGPSESTKGLYAVYKGESSNNPTVVMAHLDVVPAVKDSWESDPFQLTEIDGFLHGRGASDNKGGAAALLTTFIRLRDEGFKPQNDIIMLLTGDEETGMLGIKYFRDNFESVRNAHFALNADGGYLSGTMENPEAFRLQSAEKVYMTVTMTTSNRGGHSSIPRKDNAIYELANAIKKVETYKFPISLNQTTESTLEFALKKAEGRAKREIRAILDGGKQLGNVEIADNNPAVNAILRTTCVATKLIAGHAENALPVSATATVNCRVLPHEEPAKILTTLQDLVGNNVDIESISNFQKSPVSPITSEIKKLISESIGKIFPNLPIVATMSTGATDAISLRSIGIPVYGTSGMMTDPTGYRGHGLNERIEISAYQAALEFWYEIMQEL
jgi:acetylornithine deacetylase/succinyl-diaminopimelate desuccinylase-like protein